MIVVNRLLMYYNISGTGAKLYSPLLSGEQHCRPLPEPMMMMDLATSPVCSVYN